MFFVKQWVVPGLKSGPQLWHSFPEYQCKHQGMSAESSAQPCPCSGCCGSRCWCPGSHCPSTSSFVLSYVNSLQTLGEKDGQKNEIQRRRREKKESDVKINSLCGVSNDKWSVNEKMRYLASQYTLGQYIRL